MASISIAGKVVCKEGTEPVSLKTFDTGGQVATFSVCDLAYVYTKQGEEKKGQFYSVQVNGKGAEIAVDRLQRGDRVAVTGSLVQRDYNEKVYLDVKNATVTFLEARREAPDDTSVPF